ncbi:MAG: hypothetical protein ACM3PX_00905 [Omnitrophica WOR_2 bacterium]|jgi:hypothetical protein
MKKLDLNFQLTHFNFNLKKLIVPICMIGLISISVSCIKRKGTKLTERIQYDVTITSPEKDLEWWVQNLESNKRETLVRTITSAAVSGKHKVYDVMTNKELTTKDIEERTKRRQLITLQREYAPYEDYDTLVVNNIELSDISKIRFLEEWYLNEETGLVTKNVIAICPMLESYTESGELRGYLPLYWVSFVKKFPLAAE